MDSRKFAQLIEDTFQKSGIENWLRSRSFKVVSDTAEDTNFYNPIVEFLGWEEETYRVRFGRQVKDSRQALLMSNESGSRFQAMLSNESLVRGYEYLAPTGVGNGIFTPHIPNAVRREICHRHGLEDSILIGSDSPVFWEWFLENKNIPLVVTEGAKKSLSALSKGFVTISVYGCACLHSEALKPYLAGRDVVIAMDSDESIEKWIKVNESVLRGCQSIKYLPTSLRVAYWDAEKGKGIDDLMETSGVGAFELALTEAVPLKIFERKILNIKRKTRWVEQNLKYSSEIVMSGRYLVASEVISKLTTDTWLISVKAGLGAGKTTLLAGRIDEDRVRTGSLLDELESRGMGRGVCGLGYRNTLLLQISEKINAYHLHEHSAFQMIADPDSRITACVDSLLHFPPDYFDGKILVLDEVTSIINHLILSPTCASERSDILERFTEAIRRCSVLICLDANLSDFYLNYLQVLRGSNSSELRILNEQGSRATSLEVCPSFGRTGLINKIIEMMPLYVAEKQSVSIATDSQRLAEKLEKFFNGLGYKVFRIDSKTTKDQLVKDYIRLVPHRNFDILIYTPSCETGLNIDMDGFAHTFAFFFGVVSIPTMMQMLLRVRRATQITVQCSPYFRMALGKEMGRGNIMREIEELVLSDTDGTGEAFADWFAKQRNSPHYSTLVALEDSRRYEQSNTIDCFMEMAKCHGFDPQLIDLDEVASLKAELKQLGEEISDADAQAIFSARDISTKEALSLKGSFSSSLADHYAVKKWEMKESIPSLTGSRFWCLEGVKLALKTIDSMPKLFLQANANNLGRAKFLSNKQWGRWMKESRFVGDSRAASFAKAQIISALGLLVLPASVSQESPEIERLMEISHELRSKISRLFGLKRGALTPMQWAGRLLGLVGLRLLKDKGKAARAYSIPELDEISQLALSDLDSKLEASTHSEPEQIVESPQYLDSSEESLTSPTVFTEIAIEGIPDGCQSISTSLDSSGSDEEPVPVEVFLPLLKKDSDNLSWGERASSTSQYSGVEWFPPVVLDSTPENREWMIEDLLHSEVRFFARRLGEATLGELKEALKASKSSRREQLAMAVEDREHLELPSV